VSARPASGPRRSAKRVPSSATAPARSSAFDDPVADLTDARAERRGRADESVSIPTSRTKVEIARS